MPDTDFQKITLNLIPAQGDSPVVFYASQYETSRPFIAELYWGETEFVPGVDCWAEIDIRKNDDNLVVITDDVTLDNNEVSVVLPIQAVTCIGKNLGQIKIFADVDHMVAAFNFIIEVQPDPLAGGVHSDTAIDNLESQIAAIVPEVIGNDYYNKTETDALLADKADVTDLPDMSLYYTKTATDTLLNAKADAATTYTKSETDSLLSAKANTADLATVATTGDYDDLINKPTIPAAQVQSDYAQADNTQVDYIKNKPDINGMIAAALLAVMPVETATGNPCTFDTDIAAELQGLTADIVSTGGEGTPATPVPIVGKSALNLDVNGDTFTVSFGQTVYGGVYNAKTGKVTITHGYLALATADMNNSNDYPGWTNSGVRQIIGANVQAYPDILGNVGSIIGVNTNGSNDILFLPKPSYGNLTQSDWLTNYPDLIVQMVIPLATPIEIDVSSISVDAVVGTNNIVSDGGGDVTASYKVSFQKYVDDQ